MKPVAPLCSARARIKPAHTPGKKTDGAVREVGSCAALVGCPRDLLCLREHRALRAMAAMCTALCAAALL